MTRFIDLGHMIADDNLIAAKVVLRLDREGLRHPSNLYRGVSADEAKIERIKINGTDRQAEKQMELAQEMCEEGFSGTGISMTLKDSFLFHDPSIIFACGEEVLEKVVDYARRHVADRIDKIPRVSELILVYDGKMLEQTPTADLYEYVLPEKPEQALRALVKFDTRDSF